MRRPDDLSREELATLVREYLLGGHLIDRAGMPYLIGAYGAEPMRDIAIDEWMGASPVYSRRTRELLGYPGGDVTAICKGIQFDIGSPPQFMDFRFRVDGPDRAEFWLAHCGALMDVEPMGEEFVVAMCHDIEDPTFDATAYAGNPRARVRPIHRPPRQPADRHPHCHWTITIDPEADEVPEPPPAVRIGASLAAGLPLATYAEDPDDDGARDYAGPLQEDVRLEDFSRATLLALADEICLQGQLLALAFAVAVEERYGAEAAREAGRRQAIGVAGVVAGRLHRALVPGAGLDAMAAVLELHPAFRPRSYVDLDLEVTDRLLVGLAACPALEEPREQSWASLVDADRPDILDAIVWAVDPRARCLAVGEPGERRWEVVLEDEPRREPDEITLTRFSTGADFVFSPR